MWPSAHYALKIHQVSDFLSSATLSCITMRQVASNDSGTGSSSTVMGQTFMAREQITFNNLFLWLYLGHRFAWRDCGFKKSVVGWFAFAIGAISLFTQGITETRAFPVQGKYDLIDAPTKIGGMMLFNKFTFFSEDVIINCPSPNAKLPKLISSVELIKTRFRYLTETDTSCGFWANEHWDRIKSSHIAICDFVRYLDISLKPVERRSKIDGRSIACILPFGEDIREPVVPFFESNIAQVDVGTKTSFLSIVGSEPLQSSKNGGSPSGDEGKEQQRRYP